MRTETYQELNDIAVLQYGTAEALVQLAKANNLAIDADLVSNTLLELPTYSKPVSDPDLLKPFVPLIIEEKFVSLTYQNLIDVAVQEYGSADALVQLCKLNGLPLDHQLVAGTSLSIGEPYRLSIKTYLAERNKKVITGGDGTFNPSNALLNEDGPSLLNENSSFLLNES
jgi:hypothetical protein